MLLRIVVFSLFCVGGLSLLGQGPAAGPDPALLQRLIQRHQPEPRGFEFAAIGDQQYGPEGEQMRRAPIGGASDPNEGDTVYQASELPESSNRGVKPEIVEFNSPPAMNTC